MTQPTIAERIGAVLCDCYRDRQDVDPEKRASNCESRVSGSTVIALVYELLREESERGFRDGMHAQYKHTISGSRGLYDGTEP